MPYYTDKETYTPKFDIGERVTVNSHTDRFVGTIVARKVTRNKDRCDTFYTFDNGRNAWEWAVEHCSYHRSPGEWADNIVGWDRFTTWTLSVENGAATLWVVGSKGDARITARLLDNGKVESIGQHSVRFSMSDGTSENYWAENLGDCIVKVSNTIR